MKNLHRAILVLSTFGILATSCKREIDAPTPAHEKDNYRIVALGKSGDSSISTSMQARVQTVGIVVVEDSRLKAELIGYQKINGQGVYTVAVTNKQAGDVTLDWGWDGLKINNITPGGAHGNDMTANAYKVYTLTGDPKVGRIKVQAKGDCGNSSTLIINITMDILPIIYLGNSAAYDPAAGKVVVTFTIDAPETVSWILIQRQEVDHTWVNVAMVPADDQVKKYTIKVDPPVKH